MNENKSHKVQLEAGKKYAWCTCSFSSDQPFCDGSHRKHKATPSLAFEVDTDGEVSLCGCKQTKNPPYCDGSHKNL